MVRDPLAVRAKLIECILIAVFYGIMFYRTPNYFTNPEDFQYTWDQVMDINVSSIHREFGFIEKLNSLKILIHRKIELIDKKFQF